MCFSYSLPTFTNPCMLIVKYKMPSFPLKLFNMKTDSTVLLILFSANRFQNILLNKREKKKKLRLLYRALEHENVKCEVFTPKLVY